MVHHLRVRYGECDPQGIVFNAHYLAWFDIAMTELFRDALGSWSKLTEAGFDAVVAEAQLSFRSPARFDDEIELRAGVESLGTTSMTTAVEILRGSELLVDGRVRHVFMDRSTWEKTPIPEFVRTAFPARRE